MSLEQRCRRLVKEWRTLYKKHKHRTDWDAFAIQEACAEELLAILPKRKAKTCPRCGREVNGPFHTCYQHKTKKGKSK